MYAMERDVSRPRTVLLAGVMLAILAASTVLAWTLTLPGAGASARGAEIIAQLRKDTLDNYWTAADDVRYFVCFKFGGAPNRWRIDIRNATPSDTYSGGLTMGIAKGITQTSTWKLRSDMSQGSYVATSDLVTTRIAIDDQRVAVVRTPPGLKQKADAARPDNYVPEGALPLVLRLAAIGGREAAVKMIFDDFAIENGRINFVTARLTPMGQTAVKFEYNVKGIHATAIYRFDQDMNINRIEHPGDNTVYQLCSAETLLKEFPSLRKLIMPGD